jgi:hypothetical protein
MDKENIINEMAEAFCLDGLGIELKELYKSKADWIADRGAKHDINYPQQIDIIEGIKAALIILQEGHVIMEKSKAYKCNLCGGNPTSFTNEITLGFEKREKTDII